MHDGRHAGQVQHADDVRDRERHRRRQLPGELPRQDANVDGVHCPHSATDQPYADGGGDALDERERPCGGPRRILTGAQLRAPPDDADGGTRASRRCRS